MTATALTETAASAGTAATTPAAPAAATSVPPGPPLPMVAQTVLWMLVPIPFGTWCRRRYGDMFTLRLPFNGNVVQVCHPDGVRAVFAAPPSEALAGKANHVLEPLLGRRSVLLLDGPEHLRQRRLMLPAFHGDRMQAYVPAIEEITAAEVDTWRPGEEIALRTPMQSITLDVIIHAVFGADAGPERDQLRAVLLQLLDLPLNNLGFLPWFRRDRGERSAWGRFLLRRRQVDETVYALIASRRAELAGDHPRDRDDILSLLLRATDEQGRPMSDIEVRDELMTLLVAGHETTATALAWFFEQATRRPEVIERLTADLAAGSSAYLDACIKETLRIRPVVPVVARLLTAPLTVMGHTLPAGVAVAPNIVLTQANETVWPDPGEFRPERFLGTRTDPNAWLPFGGGIRRCLGASFATVEMRTVIPAVLRRVHLAPVGDPERQVRRTVTLVPRRGARVRVAARHSG